MAMDGAISTAAAFRQRRREMWKVMRVWLALAGLALAVFLVAIIGRPATAQMDDGYHLPLAFGSFAVFVATFIRAMFLMPRYLRCPNCETPVTDADGEPTMKASSCSKCGAQLS